MDKTKKIVICLIMAGVLCMSTMTAFAAVPTGVSDTYVLRYTPNVPSTECVYSKQWTFYANRTSTVMSATMNTSTGASVIAVSSNGIQGLLNVNGASYAATSKIGELIVAKVSLSTNGGSVQQVGTGKITG